MVIDSVLFSFSVLLCGELHTKRWRICCEANFPLFSHQRPTSVSYPSCVPENSITKTWQLQLLFIQSMLHVSRRLEGANCSGFSVLAFSMRKATVITKAYKTTFFYGDI